MKNSVDLPALAILVALLLGSALEGIVGAMVAIPTAVLVAELINEYMVQKDDAPEAAPTH
jgi:predicted PurR-regulated permease PerM